MRIILEIRSEHVARRKVLLRACQQIRVGRTEWADLAVTGDAQMSDVHFCLRTDSTACYLKDLTGGNTRVNGRPMAGTMRVRDGDEVLAGSTRFCVHAEGDSPDQVTVEQAQPRTPLSGNVAIVGAGSPEKVGFTAQTCDSGLTLCRGSVHEIGADELAERISRETAAYLLVDFRALGRPWPEEIEQPDYLFDWLDPEAATSVSPLLLAATELASWPELIQTGWQADAVLCLFSKQEKATLLAHLREVIRAKPIGNNGQNRILGFCWPSVIAMLLSQCSPDFADRLLTGIDAVLMEESGLPEAWQLFGRSGIGDVLEHVGLARRPPPEAPTTQLEEEALQSA